MKRKIDSVTDHLQSHLVQIKGGEGDKVENKLKLEYRKRKLVEEVIEKHYILRNQIYLFDLQNV